MKIVRSPERSARSMARLGSRSASDAMPRALAVDARSTAAADRGGYGSVAITQSKSGKRISAMASTFLSFITPKTRRRGGRRCSPMKGAIAATACTLWQAASPDFLSMAIDSLQPSSPSCGADAALDRLTCNAWQFSSQLLCGANGKRRVAALKLASKRRVMLAIDEDQTIPELLGATAKYGADLWIVIRSERDRSPVDDARFLRCDSGDGGAEEFGVIDVDGRDDRGHRANHVGGIEPPSHADLQYRHFASSLAKGAERDERQGLEVGRRDRSLARRRPEQLDRAFEQRHRDHRSIDHPAFAQVDKMRRRVQRGAIARGVENRGHHRRRRAFSVRARHDDRAIGMLGPAESAQQCSH